MIAEGAYLRRDRPQPEAIRLKSLDLLPSLDATYEAMAHLLNEEPARWAAWKLGGTNAGSRAAFNVDRLYYGAIADDELLDCGGFAPQAPLIELKGEAEIALRIGPDGHAWDAWAVALEMPSSPIDDLVGLGVRALVADRCAAGSLIIGPVQRGPLPEGSARIEQRVDGKVAAEGRVSDLTDSPEALFRSFMAMGRAHGVPLRPGQWVSTGGATPCISYEEGMRVEVLLDGEVQIDTIIARIAPE